MTDEKSSVPETLDSLVQKIDARFTMFEKSMAARFTMFEKSMATQFAEAKAQLGAQIEAVDTNVKIVYDTVIAQNTKNKANDDAHEQFTKRLDDHDTRILALESSKPPTSVA